MQGAAANIEIWSRLLAIAALHQHETDGKNSWALRGNVLPNCMSPVRKSCPMAEITCFAIGQTSLGQHVSTAAWKRAAWRVQCRFAVVMQVDAAPSFAEG